MKCCRTLIGYSESRQWTWSAGSEPTPVAAVTVSPFAAVQVLTSFVVSSVLPMWSPMPWPLRASENDVEGADDEAQAAGRR